MCLPLSQLHAAFLPLADIVKSEANMLLKCRSWHLLVGLRCTQDNHTDHSQQRYWQQHTSSAKPILPLQPMRKLCDLNGYDQASWHTLPQQIHAGVPLWSWRMNGVVGWECNGRLWTLGVLISDLCSLCVETHLLVRCGQQGWNRPWWPVLDSLFFLPSSLFFSTAPQVFMKRILSSAENTAVSLSFPYQSFFPLEGQCSLNVH